MALTRPKIRDIDTSIIAFNDPMTVLNQGSTIANVDVGFLFNRANGLVSNVALYWSESAQSLVTAYTTDSGVGTSNVSVASYANLTIGNMLMVNGSILNVTGNIHANIVGNLYGSVESTGNLTTSANISAAGFYWANGTPFVSSSYGNLEVSYYLPLYTGTLGNVTTSNIVVINNSTISTSVDTGALQVTGGVGIAGSLHIANTGDVSANIGNYQNWANANVAGLYNSILGANAAIVTANNAVVSYVDTLNAAMASNVASANAAIITANNAVVSYVNALNTAMAGNVSGANAAIVTANTALKSYTDNQITTANSAVVSYVNTLNTAMASNVAGANAAIVTANTSLKNYVDSQFTALVGGAPVILDTLNEIAISLGNNAQLSTTLLGAITGANAAIVTANSALKSYTDNQITTANSAVVSYVDTLNIAMASNVAGANAAIVTANSALKSYTDGQITGVTTAWTANAATQQGLIATLETQVYANSNVAAYLPTYADGVTSLSITSATNNNGLAYNNGALRVAGGTGIGGNLFVAGNTFVVGNINLTGNVNSVTVTGSSAQFFGNAAGFTALYSGISAGFSATPNTVFQSAGNFNGYIQNNFQNINGGAQGTTDWIATANNGTDTTYYVDLGIAGSGYANNSPSNSLGSSLWPNDAYLYAQGHSAGSPGGNLVIGSTIPGTVTRVLVGGVDNSSVVATFADTGLGVHTGTISTSTSTGALVVIGGAGISGSLYIANTGDVSANIGGYQSWANANVAGLYNSILGANAAIVTANSAVVSYVNTLNTAMASNVAGANAAIVTANTALKSYVDSQFTALVGGAPAVLDTLYEIANSLGNNASLSSTLLNSIAGANAAIITANSAVVSYVDTQDSAITVAWTANAKTQSDAIAGANAAIVTANTAMKGYVDAQDSAITSAWAANAATQQGLIATLQSQVYTNSNVASYLPTYTGNISAGNISANTVGTTTIVANLITTSGVYWANGSPYSSGSGTGITYTASATAPVSPNVGDQWYYTTGDILYEYQNVGTGSFWIDITSPSITSGTVTVPGGDILSPFLLMGA